MVYYHIIDDREQSDSERSLKDGGKALRKDRNVYFK
jgi:hypothetical protein